MLDAIRHFFSGGGYLEVETPLLSRDIVVDAHLEPFQIPSTDDPGSYLFLQTSPEAAMKRLLAAGSGSIFQITRSFRRAESGRRHNPEFTIVEWYGVETTYEDQMLLTQNLIHHAIHAVRNWPATAPPIATSAGFCNDRFLSPFRRTRYVDAFQSALNTDVLNASVAELQQLVRRRTSTTVDSPLPADRDDLLNLLLAECVEPRLGAEQPEFLCDYPASQAALAERSVTDDRTACRFELYIQGLELCNGYQELTDPDELRRREAEQNLSRLAHATSALPGAPLLEAAMQHGLPSCSGVALGFDRLVMCLSGADHIDQVIPFPGDRA